MTSTSDDLQNVFWVDRTEAVADKNNITVQGILEKSQSEAVAEAEASMDGLQAYLTDAVAVVGAFNEAERNSSATQPMR
jgi:hypothetical protein